MKSTIKRLLALPLAATTLFVLHCTPNFDAAKDCEQVCQKYEDCVESDFDVSECASTCRDRADEDNSFETKLDTCEDCIDTNEACAESTVQCAAECAPIYAVTN